jgi:threonine dehydratase
VSRALDADVWLKMETMTPIASFKLRGALVDILREGERTPLERVVTSSTGNHGQGVAYAARLLGLRADIFLPAEANPIKAATVQAFGASVHRVGHDNNAAKEAARRFAAETGGHFVDDGESLDLMEGAGTVGLEVARSLPAIHTMMVPVGDAPLITGSGCALKAVQPTARVIGVQSEKAAALADSYHGGERLERPVHTLADGLASRFPAERAFAGIRATADEVLTVSDEVLLRALHTLAECAHVLVEPAGAAPLAGAWSMRESLVGRRVVLILTGANVTIDMLRSALDAGPLFPVAAIV